MTTAGRIDVLAPADDSEADEIRGLRSESDCSAAQTSRFSHVRMVRPIYLALLGVASLVVLLSAAELIISWQIDAPSHWGDWPVLVAAGRVTAMLVVVLLVAFLLSRSISIRAAEPGEREPPQLQDYTDLTHLDRLRSAGHLVTGIAHEIDQPLTAISSYAAGCVKLLEQASVEHEQVLLALEEVHCNAQHAGKIIRSLREFVRRREAQREPVHCNELIMDSLVLLRTEHLIQQSDIQLDLAPDLPEVLVDPILVEQVLLNLVRNAAEARHEAGQRPGLIRICSASHAHGDVRLAVADNGPGVPEEHIPKLFTPYFTTKRDGMGVGLSLSRSIARWHGGDLRFHPNSLGGSTFEVALPSNKEAVQ